MAEVIQQTQTPAAKPVAKPGQPQPVEGQVKWYKKWWIWLIIAIVIIAVGLGIYFLV